MNTKPWIQELGKVKAQMEPQKEKKNLRRERFSMPKSSLAWFVFFVFFLIFNVKNLRKIFLITLNIIKSLKKLQNHIICKAKEYHEFSWELWLRWLNQGWLIAYFKVILSWGSTSNSIWIKSFAYSLISCQTSSHIV